MLLLFTLLPLPLLLLLALLPLRIDDTPLLITPDASLDAIGAATLRFSSYVTPLPPSLPAYYYALIELRHYRLLRHTLPHAICLIRYVVGYCYAIVY